jgi:5'-nucleotidase
VGAFGITERSIVTPGRSRSPVFGVALGMGLALLIVGGIAGIAKLGAARGGTVASSPLAPASSVVPGAPGSAVPGTAAPVAASVAPVAAPVASSALPVASSGAVPTTKPTLAVRHSGRPAGSGKPGGPTPTPSPTVAPTVAEGRE